MAPAGLLPSFLAAIQASLSVLLVIFYGGVAAHLKLLNPASTKAISKVCVRMFLPALLIVQIGSQLHADSAGRYLVILVWALICHFVSFVIGILAHLCLGMPDWTTVAIMFNNTTSYPLLLVAALDETGILRALIPADETTRAAVERAKAYFLVFATISSCLTFAVGPRLIDSEHAPEPEEEEENKNGQAAAEQPAGSGDAAHDNGHTDEAPAPAGDGHDATEETALVNPLARSSTIQFADPFGPHRRANSFFPSSRKPSLAPTNGVNGVQNQAEVLVRRASMVPRKTWLRLGPRTKWWLLFISDFFNAPLLGAIIGAVIGLTPALHRAFFADSADGGIFTAWLTASLKSIGQLFVPLPVVVAGVSLYTAMLEARQGGGGADAKLPRVTTIFILVVRFVIWPVASILVVWALAAHTSLLSQDPMLWFTLMLMPTGPPAMKLITLVQVSDADEAEERNIAKLLTISYLISPILSLTVVGALRASQAGTG